MHVQANRRNILRSSFGISVATIMARILGLIRVMLEARVLGGGALASAWQLAVMMPNLFRRLFGEGALSTALIPLLSHLEAERGLTEVRKQLAVVFVLLSVLLAGVTVVVSGISLLLLEFVTADYVRTALKLTPILMPYTIFVCLVGVITAVVNTRRVFFLASLNALVLSVVLILMLFFGRRWYVGHTADFLTPLSWSVLVAGVLELAMMVVLMRRCGIFPIFRDAQWRHNRIFRDLFVLAMPGMIGGAASQVSFLVDRTLACWVGDYAVASLTYSERLIYLPVGVFAMALSSVLMADMSRAAAQRNYTEMLDDCALGLRYVWYFCAPLGVFLVVWREPLIRVLFMYGKFTELNVQQTAWALLFYALGIPAFCATKVILPTYYARKMMMTPLKISLIAVGVNVILSVLLMLVLGQGGIALATVISAMINNSLLLLVLRRQELRLPLRPVVMTAAKALAASGLGALLFLRYESLRTWTQEWGLPRWMPQDLIPVLAGLVGFGVIYLAVTMILRAHEPWEMFHSFLGRRPPADDGRR